MKIGNHPLHLKHIDSENVAGYEQQQIDIFRDYIGSTTPRDNSSYDPRMCIVAKDTSGKRCRSIRDAMALSIEEVFEDWGLTGPRSAVWCMGFCADQTGSGFSARALQFMSTARLQMTEPNMLEYNVLMKTLDLAYSVDQLNMANNVCIELICRRVALIEEKYKYRLPQFDQGKST